MGLGDRGKNKVKEAAAPELFRMPEPLTDVHNNIDTKIYTSVKPDIHKPVSEKMISGNYSIFPSRFRNASANAPMKHDIRKRK